MSKLLLILAAALLLISTAGEVLAAEPAPRVVLLDALTLPASFEQANVRAKVRAAVEGAVRRRGWEPVSITTGCRNLDCAGAVAREAKTVYALLLTGQYAGTDTFATDVGVWFWRDGSVVASRTDSDEEAELEKIKGSLFMPCGPPDGACTPDLLTTKLEQYAGRLLDNENAAIKARATATAVTTTPAIITPPPASVPGPVVEQGRRKRIFGWSLIGAGVLAGAGAVALWAYDGRQFECSSLPGDSCRSEHRAKTAAIVTGAAGIAAVIGGVVLLSIDRGDGRMALSVHPSGISVGGTF
jgi:hypothetical protein